MPAFPTADPAVLDRLRRFDTPTVCNVLELFAARPRTTGYMDARITACFPKMPPMVGYASTATFRAGSPPRSGDVYAGLAKQVELIESAPAGRDGGLGVIARVLGGRDANTGNRRAVPVGRSGALSIQAGELERPCSISSVGELFSLLLGRESFRFVRECCLVILARSTPNDTGDTQARSQNRQRAQEPPPSVRPLVSSLQGSPPLLAAWIDRASNRAECHSGLIGLRRRHTRNSRHQSARTRGARDALRWGRSRCRGDSPG